MPIEFSPKRRRSSLNYLLLRKPYLIRGSMLADLMCLNV